MTQSTGHPPSDDDFRLLVEQLSGAQRLAAESLTMLETLQSKAPVGFVFVDRDFRYVRVNEAAAAMNGVPVQQHFGRTVAEVVPTLWPEIEPVYRQVLDRGETVVNLKMAAETAAQPGVIRNWLVSFYPVRIDEETIGIGTVIVEVTERNQAEEFRSAVMDNMVEGLYTLDGDGLLTYMNRAASKMLGWTEEELRGRPMHAAVHFQNADGAPVPSSQCSLLSVTRHGRPVQVPDDAFTRKEGSIFPVAYSAAPLRIGSAAHGVVVVFRDITAETENEARIQRELATLSWVGKDPRRAGRRSLRLVFPADRSPRRRRPQRRALATHGGKEGRSHPARQLPARRRAIRPHR